MEKVLFRCEKAFPMFKQFEYFHVAAENRQIGFFYYSKIACANINWQLDELKITILKNYTKNLSMTKTSE